MTSDITSDPVEEKVAPDAPSVVAIVVTSDPGPWFEETLMSLGGQTYPGLQMLVVDAESKSDPLPRIAAAAPSAYVRRLKRNPGFGAAVNRCLRNVGATDYILICHDDIAPASDAVQVMVEQAEQKNAAIVVPKLVEWDDPYLLQDLGGSVDATGAYVPRVEPGDRDQGQYDDPSLPVFVAQGGCMLVRRSVFEALDGFDGAIGLHGETVDLCWRAQVTGSTVLCAPRARVRHLAAATRGLRLLVSGVDGAQAGQVPGEVRGSLVRKHELRSVLKCRQGYSLILLVPALAILNLGEFLYALIVGRGEHAHAVANAWSWNTARLVSLVAARRKLAKLRSIGDSRLAPQFASTRDRLDIALRAEWESRRARMANEMKGRELVGVLRNLPLAVWATIFVVWLVGSRELLSGPIPAVGQFAQFPSSAWDALRHFSGAVPVDGFGEVAMSSPLNLVIGLLGVVFFGSMKLLQSVLVLGMLPLGVIGVSRLMRHLNSPRARLVALLVYAAVPLPYDAFAYGRWDALVAYAAAPFVLARLLRINSITPFEAKSETMLRRRLRRRRFVDDDPLDEETLAHLRETTAAAMFDARQLVDEAPSSGAPGKPGAIRLDRMWFLLLRRVIPLSLLLGLAGSVSPQTLTVTVLAGLCLSLTVALGDGKVMAALESLGLAVLGALFAVILLGPDVLGGQAGPSLLWTHSHSVIDPDSLFELWQMHGAGNHVHVATVGLLLAALPALAVGRDWRFGLSVRLWVVTASLVTLTWLGARGWLGGIVLDPHATLPFAAAALALNVGVGISALQDDLRAFNFGWRQLLPLVAIAGVVAAMVPIAGRAGDGGWQLPRVANAEVLGWMADRRSDGDFRVLWLGDPNTVPGKPRALDKGLHENDSHTLAAALFDNRAVGDELGEPADGGRAQRQLDDVVTRARDGDTVQLGRLLAPYSVRYIVVPQISGATDAGGVRLPQMDGLMPALSNQLDLRSVDTDASIAVYENVAWIPKYSMLPPAGIVASHNGDRYSAQAVDMSGAPSVFHAPGASPSTSSFSGTVSQEELYVSEAASGGWRVMVDGKKLKPQAGFAWAQTYAFPAQADAKLVFTAPRRVLMAQILCALLWIVLFVVGVRHRAIAGRNS